MAKKIRFTGSDERALALIIKNGGWIGYDMVRGPYLHTQSQISNERFEHLLALGLLKPAADALIEGGKPQTYVLSEDNQYVESAKRLSHAHGG